MFVSVNEPWGFIHTDRKAKNRADIRCLPTTNALSENSWLSRSLSVQCELIPKSPVFFVSLLHWLHL